MTTTCTTATLRGVEVTHISLKLNDGSVAGLVWHDKKCMGIQYHPEAGP
jgi:carbamoylphosphate synthase small subunit